MHPRRYAVWGGCDGDNYFDDGKAYDPGTGAWTAIAGFAACTPAVRAYDDGTRFAP